MNFLGTLLLYFYILYSQPSSADAGRLHDGFRKFHHTVKRNTRSIASDLRIAFGGVLVSQPRILLEDNARTVFCKANQGLLGNGQDENGGPSSTSPVSSSSSSSSSNSQSLASSSQPTASSTSISTSTSSTSTSFSSSSSRTSTSASSSASPTTTPISTPWKLVKEHSGTSFFEGWDFWTAADPNSGTVNYLSESDGRNAGLVSVNGDGQAIMRIDTTPTLAATGNRNSIRITTKDSYNGFLVLMDSVHIPTGCGTWPAFWTNGPGWPAGGEIDIVEGVHDSITNQVALHTDPGCSMSADLSRVQGAPVSSDTNCAANETGNAGCGVKTNSQVSFGSAFNNNGGGVYATRWAEDGINIWFFARNQIPSDIDASTPQPSGWGDPIASFGASSCAPFKYFYDNVAIFTSTLCGDWATGAWNSAGTPGQDQSCSARTGYATCEDFVRNSGASFSEAYWQVNYVKFYQTET